MSHLLAAAWSHGDCNQLISDEPFEAGAAVWLQRPREYWLKSALAPSHSSAGHLIINKSSSAVGPNHRYGSTHSTCFRVSPFLLGPRPSAFHRGPRVLLPHGTHPALGLFGPGIELYANYTGRNSGCRAAPKSFQCCTGAYQPASHNFYYNR